MRLINITAHEAFRRRVGRNFAERAIAIAKRAERPLKIAAKVENGVMTIEIPKKKETEAAVAARQIEVR